MDAVELAIFSWALYAYPAVEAIRLAKERAPRLREIAAGLVFSASLAPLVIANWSGGSDPLCHYSRLGFAGVAATIVPVAQWYRFREGRYALPWWGEFAVFLCTLTALVVLLLLLARRLYAVAPFAAVLAGALSFFLPVNAAAEVFCAGREAGRARRRSGGRNRKRRANA